MTARNLFGNGPDVDDGTVRATGFGAGDFELSRRENPGRG